MKKASPKTKGKGKKEKKNTFISAVLADIIRFMDYKKKMIGFWLFLTVFIIFSISLQISVFSLDIRLIAWETLRLGKCTAFYFLQTLLPQQRACGVFS